MPHEQKLEQLPPAEQIQSVACIVIAHTYLQIRFEQHQIASVVTSGGDAMLCLGSGRLIVQLHKAATKVARTGQGLRGPKASVL